MNSKKDHRQSGFFAKALLGRRVANAQGDALGVLEDFYIHPDATVGYAVLSHGGVLGSTLGDKRFAVPLKCLRPVHGNTADPLVLDVSRQWLDQAPGFDPDAPPVEADQSFLHLRSGFPAAPPAAMI